MFKPFFENLSGFLFRPFATALENFSEGASGAGRRGRFLFAVYVSVLIGVTVWFLIFYPEPLYYGTSGAALKREVPAILFANPIHSLLVVVAASLAIIFAFMYLFMGLLSHSIMVRVTGQKTLESGSYLSLYSFTLAPLLFWVPCAALRIFLFERWINIRPLYPFIDWNAPNAVYLALTGAFILWKLAIEVRINQAVFKTSFLKASVPVAVQLSLLVFILLIPLALNDLIFEALKAGLV